ncbi:MAG: hypothetical protein NVS1B6_19710 [Steroidobacteraceae bacterium]
MGSDKLDPPVVLLDANQRPKLRPLPPGRNLAVFCDSLLKSCMAMEAKMKH